MPDIFDKIEPQFQRKSTAAAGAATQTRDIFDQIEPQFQTGPAGMPESAYPPEAFQPMQQQPAPQAPVEAPPATPPAPAGPPPDPREGIWRSQFGADDQKVQLMKERSDKMLQLYRDASPEERKLAEKRGVSAQALARFPQAFQGFSERKPTQINGKTKYVDSFGRMWDDPLSLRDLRRTAGDIAYNRTEEQQIVDDIADKARKDYFSGKSADDTAKDVKKHKEHWSWELLGVDDPKSIVENARDYYSKARPGRIHWRDIYSAAKDFASGSEEGVAPFISQLNPEERQFFTASVLDNLKGEKERAFITKLGIKIGRGAESMEEALASFIANMVGSEGGKAEASAAFQVQGLREQTDPIKAGNIVGQTVLDVGEMAPEMAAGILLNAGTAGVAGSALWGATATGRSIEQLKAAGFPDEVAIPTGIAAGVVNGLLMTGQAGKMLAGNPAALPQLTRGFAPITAAYLKKAGVNTVEALGMQGAMELDRLGSLYIASQLDPKAPPVDWAKEVDQSLESTIQAAPSLAAITVAPRLPGMVKGARADFRGLTAKPEGAGVFSPEGARTLIETNSEAALDFAASPRPSRRQAEALGLTKASAEERATLARMMREEFDKGDTPLQVSVLEQKAAEVREKLRKIEEAGRKPEPAPPAEGDLGREMGVEPGAEETMTRRANEEATRLKEQLDSYEEMIAGAKEAEKLRTPAKEPAPPAEPASAPATPVAEQPAPASAPVAEIPEAPTAEPVTRAEADVLFYTKSPEFQADVKELSKRLPPESAQQIAIARRMSKAQAAEQARTQETADQLEIQFKKAKKRGLSPEAAMTRALGEVAKGNIEQGALDGAEVLVRKKLGLKEKANAKGDGTGAPPSSEAQGAGQGENRGLRVRDDAQGGVEAPVRAEEPVPPAGEKPSGQEGVSNPEAPVAPEWNAADLTFKQIQDKAKELGLKSRGSRASLVQDIHRELARRSGVSAPEPAARKKFESEVDVGTRELKAKGWTDEQIADAKARGMYPIDEVTGYQEGRAGGAKTDRANTMQRAIAHIEETGEQGSYVEMDLRNVGGLNERFGHSGANVHLRKMADIIKEELSAAGADVNLFRHGGDELSAVVINAKPEAVDAAMKRASTRIDDYAKSIGVENLENPKHKGNLTKVGTGVIFAVEEMKRGDKAHDVFSAADKRVELLKKEYGNGPRPTEKTRTATSPGQAGGDGGRAAPAAGGDAGKPPQESARLGSEARQGQEVAPAPAPKSKGLRNESPGFRAFYEQELKNQPSGSTKTAAEVYAESKSKWQKMQQGEGYTGGPVGGMLAYGAPLPEGTGALHRVNLENIDAGYDVKKVIVDEGLRSRGKLDEARRGKQSHEATQELADAMGMTADELLKRQKGQAYNAEQATAARNLLVASAERVDQLGKEANKRGSSKETLDRWRQALLTHTKIQAEVEGIAAEAGRTLEAHKIKSKSTELYRQLLEGVKPEDINGLSPGDLARKLRPLLRVTKADMFFEAWINFLLSGPKTHLSNILSNELTLKFKAPERAVAAAIDLVRSLGPGQKRERYFGESVAGLMSAKTGMLDGIRAGLDALIRELPPEGGDKVEGAKFQAIPGKLGKVMRTPVRLLSAEDVLFKARAYAGELYARAYRKAASEGLAGKRLVERTKELISSPTEEMITAAKAEADVATFTNPYGEWGKKLNSLRQIPAMRWVVPFLRTPTNIAKFALARTPLNFVRLGYKIARGQLKGGAVSDELAKPVLGSTISMAAVALAKAGLVTGGGPTSQAEKDRLYRTGWRPYSIKVGDQYIGFGRLEPLSSIFGMAVDFAESANDPEKRLDEKAIAMSYSVGRNISSKTFLKGLSGAMNAMLDPERYGDNFIESMAGSMVPSVVNTVKQVQDPTMRQAEGPWEKIKGRIPWVSESVVPRRDIWGRAVQIEETAVERAASPISRSTAKDDPVDTEVNRLKLNLGMPPKKLDMGHDKGGKKIEAYEMNPMEYDAYVVASGEEAYKLAKSIMQTPGYKQANDERKKEMIETRINRARDRARREMLKAIKSTSS